MSVNIGCSLISLSHLWGNSATDQPPPAGVTVQLFDHKVTYLLWLWRVLTYQQVFFNPASKQQSKSFSGVESSSTAPSDKETPPSGQLWKTASHSLSNHNKPLLRQSLTGFPSGSCVTSWDNEITAPRPTTCSLFHLIHHTISTALWTADRKRAVLFINMILLHG